MFGKLSKINIFTYTCFTISLIINKGANQYQKVVGQNGAGKGISGLLPGMYFWKVIFALNKGFQPWIFGAGQKEW